MRLGLLLPTLALLIALPTSPAAAQEAPDVRPRVVERRSETPPTPDVAARIADLEERRHAAEGRAAAFGALTIGGTALVVGGVVAMVVVAAIGPMGCTGMEDCVQPVEDFAPGISLTIAGASAVAIGGILWGDADAAASRLGERIEELRRGVQPSFSLGPGGFRLGLRGTF